jgi:serine phosphatase RsbU (regulator of sigma subunit)
MMPRQVPLPEVSANLAELAALSRSPERSDEVLHRITVLATRTLAAAASCSVTIQSDDEPTTVTAANDLAVQLDELQYTADDGPCLQALRDNKVIQVDSMAEETRWNSYPQRAFDHGVLSSLSVPLTLDDKALAALNIYATVTGGFVDDSDRGMAELFAAQAAVTLNNAAHYRRDREIALTLQRSLLPEHLPHLDGLMAAARYRPGTLDTEAGGDFYDLIPLPGGRVGIAIGDVMGRGVAAAAVMGQLRAAVRAYALEDHPPALLLERLDRVVQSLGTGTLTTCTYAVYDPASRLLEIGTAGHLPPLLAGLHQPTRYLDLEPGLPLGVHDSGSTFHQTSLSLPPGSTLVLYTDGLVEARDQPLDIGMARLAAAVDQTVLPPERVCDHVLAELGRGTDSDDDVALFVLSTAPEPPQPDEPARQ